MINISTDLTDAHYVDCARNNASSVATSSVGFTSGTTFPDITPDPAKIQITSMEELALIGNDASYPLNGDYELMNNLDATGVTFWPIGLSSSTLTSLPFTGTFDGNYFTISNLTINDTIIASGGSSNNVGLFSKFDSATIENLSISNMAITSTGSFGAGLLAHTSLGGSIITNVRTSGTISSIGALSDTNVLLCAGLIYGANSILTRCSSDVTILTNGRTLQTGGLVKIFGGTATDCYSKGSITITGTPTFGLLKTGGMFGEESSLNKTYTNCYSAFQITGTELSDVGGFVGKTQATTTYSDCFWDSDLYDGDDTGDSGDVANITASTTSAMKAQSTFTNWDFSTVWQINEGNDYPRHQWFINNVPPVTGDYATATFTQGISVDGNLNHLEGETVSILADGEVQAQQTVTSGAITEPGGTTHVGLPYKAKLTPMKPDKVFGRIQRIVKVFLKLFRSQGGTMGNDTQNNLEYEVTTAYTGRLEVDFPGLYDRDGETTIEHSDPTPVTVISQTLKAYTNEGN